MSFMNMCDLWGWKGYDAKFYGNLVRSMVRVKMIEWSPFAENEISCDCVQWQYSKRTKVERML